MKKILHINLHMHTFFFFKENLKFVAYFDCAIDYRDGISSGVYYFLTDRCRGSNYSLDEYIDKRYRVARTF